MENLSVEQQERSEGIVIQDKNTDTFAKYAEERDKWLATPIASNTTLARGGYPFTILDAVTREFDATEMDVARGFKIGEPITKIAYLCQSQMTWTHYPINEADVTFDKGEYFIILMNENPIRIRDFDRIKQLLNEGPIHNISIQEYANKVKGFNPSHGLVSAHQWKPLLT